VLTSSSSFVGSAFAVDKTAPSALIMSHRYFSTADPTTDTTTTFEYSLAKRADVRNVAIVAHVDHGKTTLVDELLKAGTEDKGGDRLMDSGDLEKERGITITSKVTRLEYTKQSSVSSIHLVMLILQVKWIVFWEWSMVCVLWWMHPKDQ
jgi:hypothetical protein